MSNPEGMYMALSLLSFGALAYGAARIGAGADYLRGCHKELKKIREGLEKNGGLEKELGDTDSE